MIVKYIYNKEIYCTYYNNIKEFLKECYNPTFKDKFNKSTDVILLENNGHSYVFNNLKEVYKNCLNKVYRFKE